MQDLSPAQAAEISALADGSLDPTRRDSVEAWLASSPELLHIYERERAAVDLLRHAATERAPARLRMQVHGQRASRPRRARAWAGGALAGALAAAILAVVLLLPGGTPGSPSVSQAAELALRGPSAPAPAPDSSDPRTKLSERFQALYFPNWSTTLRWRAVGMRRDRLEGRSTMTVYYQRGGGLVAYTIVGSPALGSGSSRVAWRNGRELHIFTLAGRTVVTWRRAGHTCVISAAGVPVSALEQLAGWRASVISD